MKPGDSHSDQNADLLSDEVFSSNPDDFEDDHSITSGSLRTYEGRNVVAVEFIERRNLFLSRIWLYFNILV